MTLNPIFGSGACVWHPDNNPLTIRFELLLNNSKWNGLQEGTATPIKDAKLVDGNWETELPQVGSTEIWDMIGLSNDDHPIHLRLGQRNHPPPTRSGLLRCFGEEHVAGTIVRTDGS